MRVLPPLIVLALLAPLAGAQSAADADADGIDDALEQALLARFLPDFQVGEQDCDLRPARFEAGSITPRRVARDGTIYGQVSPGPRGDGELELHYYHLWNFDCGAPSHPLDAEHVSALVRAGGERAGPAAAGVPADRWTATHWYAAAHEDTACDASHGARAASLDAAAQGPVVWISEGKHASFLDPGVCEKACGADRCDRTVPLAVAAVVNLDERGAPMNGADWIASDAWPLAEKLETDFGDAVLAALDAAADGDVVTVAPGTPMRHFATHTTRGLSRGRRETGSALGRGGREAGAAIRRGLGAVGAALGLSGEVATDGAAADPGDDQRD
jgi:hypothetical protein